MTKLYHRDVYWKDYFDADSYNLFQPPMKVSYHTMEHISDNTQKRYNFTLGQLLSSLDKCKTPFEVEIEDNTVTKAVYRVSLSKDRDISIVIRKGMIVTAWVNDMSDVHTTLDKSKYNKT